MDSKHTSAPKATPHVRVDIAVFERIAAIKTYTERRRGRTIERQFTGGVVLATYVGLKSFDGKHGECFPDVQTVAKRINASASAVKYAIAGLIKAGLVEKTNRGNTKKGQQSNRYIFPKARGCHTTTGRASPRLSHNEPEVVTQPLSNSREVIPSDLSDQSAREDSPSALMNGYGDTLDCLKRLGFPADSLIVAQACLAASKGLIPRKLVMDAAVGVQEVGNAKKPVAYFRRVLTDHVGGREQLTAILRKIPQAESRHVHASAMAGREPSEELADSLQVINPWDD